MKSNFRSSAVVPRKLRITLLTSLLVLGAPSLRAMDLLQAYQAALTQDANTLAANATAQAGREAVPQARAQLLPNVSASFTRNRNKLDSATTNSLGQVSDGTNAYPSSTNALTVRQAIFRPHQWAQLQQAKARVDDVNAVLDYTLQTLAVTVTSTYLEALLAEDQLALMKTQLAAYYTQMDAARKMFAGGSGTRTDVDEVQARLDMGLAQELEAKQNVDYTRQQLQLLVNQSVDKLAGLEAAKLVLASPDPATVSDWIDRAEQFSPELRVMRARLVSADYDVEMANAGHLPTLDAVAQWSRNSSENTSSINSTYETRTIGLQLNIPLFSGGSTSSVVRQALANKEKAAQSLEAARRDLGVRVHKEFRGVSEGVLRVRALEQAARSAEQVLLSSQKSFQGGSRTRLDVLNAESSRMQIRRDLAQARYNYLLASLRLKALAGEANVDSVAHVNRFFSETNTTK